jgi:CheY-like chemotaxis protein
LGVLDDYSLFANLIISFKTMAASKNIKLPPIVAYMSSQALTQSQADAELFEGVQCFSQPINYVNLEEMIDAFGLKKEITGDLELGENAVLVVDEVAFSRVTMDKGLKRMGLEVISVKSVPEALLAYQQYPQIKLVCTKTMVQDVSVGQLYSACEKIERYTDEGPVPMADFILLADQKDKVEMCNFTKLGIKNVLLRPLPTDKILTEIKTALERVLEVKDHLLDPLSVLNS